MGTSVKRHWSIDFLQAQDQISSAQSRSRSALIILNQPFSFSLLQRLWNSTDWHCCADGGANRLFDLLDQAKKYDESHELLLPDLIKGDLDSLRSDVQEYYRSKGVSIVKDEDQDTTDLMKCVSAIREREQIEKEGQYVIIVLGGLTGRLDQTIHTLSYLHKLRKDRDRVFAVTDDNIGWVLDSGNHTIHVDHDILGPTCGLLPVGVDSTIISTSGLRWNLTNHPSSFDGLVSTSNHFVLGKNVCIETSKPIWWTAELRKLD